ncbi:hypothetical protein BJY04DRAFT_213084 [Aspergillus karnatakaensis]|uniref:uncharacterized protein n=1 Tax=Aspergillus karnatakaensis TaxID=1810916 RepID=UPI003CCDC2C3
MGPYVPPGQSPPFQVVDDLHHGAWVIIVVALGLVLSLVSFLIRLYVRLALNPPFGKDDYVLLGATVFAIIQAALLFEASAVGLGTSIDLLESKDVDIIQILIVVADILYLIILYTTKCCVVGIYLRITPQRIHNRASWATLTLCTLWVIPAIFVLTVNCGFKQPLKGTGGQCNDLLERWQFIVALDIATELILFGLAVFLLAGLFMPLKRKFTIAFAFIFRLPVIIFAVLHIYYLQKDIGSRDPTLDAVPSLIWAQVELNYALVACSIFCLRPFMAAVSTNYGTAGDSTLESSSRDASKHKSAESKSGGSGNRGTLLIGNETMAFGVLQRSDVEFEANGKRAQTQTVESSARPPAEELGIELVEQGRGMNVASHDSRKMIIRKDVEYTIEFGGVRSPGVEHNEPEYWDRQTDDDPNTALLDVMQGLRRQGRTVESLGVWVMPGDDPQSYETQNIIDYRLWSSRI